MRNRAFYVSRDNTINFNTTLHTNGQSQKRELRPWFVHPKYSQYMFVIFRNGVHIAGFTSAHILICGIVGTSCRISTLDHWEHVHETEGKISGNDVITVRLHVTFSCLLHTRFTCLCYTNGCLNECISCIRDKMWCLLTTTKLITLHLLSQKGVALFPLTAW